MKFADKSIQIWELPNFSFLVMDSCTGVMCVRVYVAAALAGEGAVHKWTRWSCNNYVEKR